MTAGDVRTSNENAIKIEGVSCGGVDLTLCSGGWTVSGLPRTLGGTVCNGMSNGVGPEFSPKSEVAMTQSLQNFAVCSSCYQTSSWHCPWDPSLCSCT